MRHDRIEVGIVDGKGDAREWIALKHLKEDSGEHDNHRLYKYCCALIDLASEMCLERNHRALNYFIDIYPINIVMKAIMHNELDYNVKSKFTRMIEIMYVNREPFDHLKVPYFSRIWSDISLIGNRIEYYKGEIPQYILEIRTFTVQYLIQDTKGEQSIFDGEKNQMTLQVIKLIKLMVSYGFYRTKEELRELSVTLISLLNGTNDTYNLKNEDYSNDDAFNPRNIAPRTLADKGEIDQRYEKTQDNLVIMHCKEEICDILLRILEIENDLKISLFLGYFKDGIESNAILELDNYEEHRYNESASHKVFPEELERKDLTEDIAENKHLSQNKTSPAKNPISDSDAIKWLEKVLMGEQLFDAFPQGSYVCILMDLLAYDYTNLNNKAFELLLKFFNQRSSLIELLEQIQLLERPDSIKILRRVTKISLELKSFIDVVNQWVDEESKSTKNIIDISATLLSTKESVDYLASILVERNQNSRQGILEEIPNTGRSHEESLVIGMNGKIMKRNEISNKDLTPNVENQRLMKNLGIPGILIQILKISLSEGQKNNEDYQDMIMSIYLFLIRFCTDDQDNQDMIGEHLDFFLKELDFCPIVIFLVKEIFKNNKGFMASKRMSVVQYIAQREARMSIDSAQKQHYLMILKTLSKKHSKGFNKSANEILNLITPIDDSTIQCYFEHKDEMKQAQQLVAGFKRAIGEQFMSVKEKEESNEKETLSKSEALFGYLKIILDYLERSDFFLPFKKSVVEYFYHIIKSKQRDILSSESCNDLFWRIIGNLLEDCEFKANADDLHDEVKSYGYPLNQSFKAISDTYIYKVVYMAFSSTMKMKFEFDQVSQIMKRIAVVTSQLYYRNEDTPDMIRWVSDVLVTMKNTSALARYLSQVRTPFDEEDEINLDHHEDQRTHRRMNKKITK